MYYFSNPYNPTKSLENSCSFNCLKISCLFIPSQFSWLHFIYSSCIYLLSSESPVSLKFQIHKILFPFLCCCFCIFAFRTNFALTLTCQIMYYIKKHLQSWENRINMLYTFGKTIFGFFICKFYCMIQIKFGDYTPTLNESKEKAKYEQCYQLKSIRKV